MQSKSSDSLKRKARNPQSSKPPNRPKRPQQVAKKCKKLHKTRLVSNLLNSVSKRARICQSPSTFQRTRPLIWLTQIVSKLRGKITRNWPTSSISRKWRRIATGSKVSCRWYQNRWRIWFLRKWRCWILAVEISRMWLRKYRYYPIILSK